MLTLFTTCRPFDNQDFTCIQRNAMTSWSHLKPLPEVLVMGIECGVKEMCEELGYRHVPDIEYSDHGTPMLDSMMSKAEELASNPHLLLVSCDVVLFQDTMKALEALKEDISEFCACVRKKQQRTITELDFSKDWESVVRRNLRWNLITSGDFYMYPKGYWDHIPEFIVGRTACDSWLFHEASRKESLVDLTQAVEIIDYQHRYTHRPKGWELETKQNQVLCDGRKADIRNANWVMQDNFKLRRTT